VSVKRNSVVVVRTDSCASASERSPDTHVESDSALKLAKDRSCKARHETLDRFKGEAERIRRGKQEERLSGYANGGSHSKPPAHSLCFVPPTELQISSQKNRQTLRKNT